MIGYIENVKIISSFQTRSKPYRKIENRNTHGFVYRIKGYADYTINSTSFRVNEGEIVFLPKGSTYEYTTSAHGDNLYTSINFEADIQDMEISVYSLIDFPGAIYLKSFSNMWKFGNSADKYSCLANFHEMLSYISRLDHLSNSEKENHQKILPAIDYLKEHIYDVNFKVSKLHRLCGISDTYFRNIFKSIFAITPQEYVLKERLAQAKLIIESGDYDIIKSVAESVGYSDALYFSKAFRKIYGFPPSAICE